MNEPGTSQQTLDFEAHLKRADELRTKGSLDEAVVEYKKAMEKKQGDPRSHIGLGITYHMKAELEPLYSKPALHHLKEAVRLNPNDEEAHNKYILAGCQQGMIASIHEEYAKLYDQHRDNPIFKACHERLNIMIASVFDQATIEKNLTLGETSVALPKMIAILSWISMAGGFLTILIAPLAHQTKVAQNFPIQVWAELALLQLILGVVGLLTSSMIRSR